MAKLLSTCKHCGKEFEHWKYKNRSFCSRKCYIKSSKKKIKNNCKNCDTIFEHKKSMKRLYCSRECATRERARIPKKLITKICYYCKKEFSLTPHLKRKFCSRDCYHKNHGFFKYATEEEQKRLRFKYFDKYVVRTSEGCWKWTGRVNIGGYPQLADNYPAHKFSYEYYVKPIPKGLYALHHCDTRSCCNFSHIFLGTLNDNNQDMIKKGRMYINYGGKSPKRKLSDEQVIEIKKLLKTGLSQNKISKKFNISQSGIVDIKSGRTYKNVKDAE